MLSFLNEEHYKAKKPRTCEACGEEICVGEEYCRQTGKWDGKIFTRSWHLDCEKLMDYFFSDLATDETFEYGEVEDEYIGLVCHYCNEGPNKDDTCDDLIWHCQKVQDYVDEKTKGDAE